MQSKSKPECCNGDCNQGRDCPIRIEMRKQPIIWSHVWHNLLNFTNYKFNFTPVELLAMIAVVIFVTLAYTK
jgi:hypothetical protein